jgi:hypothetical protein
MSSPRALPIACASARRRAPERGKPVDVDVVDDVEEDEVVEIFFFGLSAQSSQNIFSRVVRAVWYVAAVDCCRII